nr:uncharacterized protein LOC126528894 [Dermacentor andersoni]
MRKVAIEVTVNEQTKLETLCRGLNQYGVVDRLFLEPVLVCDAQDMFKGKNYVYVAYDSMDMLDCEAFREVCMSSHGGQPNVPLRNAIRLLSSLSHITSVTIEIEPTDLDAVLASTIADYIQTSSTLRKLHLSSWSEEPGLTSSEHHWKTVFESLSKNRTIKELILNATHLSSEEIYSLADAVKSSRSIRSCDFVFGDDFDWIEFLRVFGHDIADSYSITNASLWVDRSYPDEWEVTTWQVTVKWWFAVMDTARRNASLVSRAAQFLSGPRCDRYCFSALEQVYQHPPLLEHLAEVMSLSVSDTVSMVRDARRSVRDVHGFMRIAGVVRDRVVCHPRQDGHMQLDDLDEHCWSLVRRFLQLDDVLVACATSS